MKGAIGEAIVMAKCPYCEVKQEYIARQGFNVLLCYPEEGGCDRYFVIDMQFVAKITTFEMVEVAEKNTEVK